jgi:hypothetical protein
MRTVSANFLLSLIRPNYFIAPEPLSQSVPLDGEYKLRFLDGSFAESFGIFDVLFTSKKKLNGVRTDELGSNMTPSLLARH